MVCPYCDSNAVAKIVAEFDDARERADRMELARDALADLWAQAVRRAERAEADLRDLRRQMEAARADGEWPLAKVLTERDEMREGTE